jgi:hypothetical protein
MAPGVPAEALAGVPRRAQGTRRYASRLAWRAAEASNLRAGVAPAPRPAQDIFKARRDRATHVLTRGN